MANDDQNDNGQNDNGNDAGGSASDNDGDFATVAGEAFNTMSQSTQNPDVGKVAEEALAKAANAVRQHADARSNEGEVSALYVAASLPIGLLYALDDDITGIEYALPAVAPVLSWFANWSERKAVEDTRQPARFTNEIWGEAGGKEVAKVLGWKEDTKVDAVEVNLNNGLAALTLAAPYLARLAQKK